MKKPVATSFKNRKKEKAKQKENDSVMKDCAANEEEPSEITELAQIQRDISKLY